LAKVRFDFKRALGLRRLKVPLARNSGRTLLKAALLVWLRAVPTRIEPMLLSSRADA
jgi:hypothetical protein